MKLFCRPATGVVVGGVVVAPRRSRADPADRAGGAERPHVEDLAYTFAVYPSLSGSITEAAGG